MLTEEAQIEELQRVADIVQKEFEVSPLIFSGLSFLTQPTGMERKGRTVLRRTSGKTS